MIEKNPSGPPDVMPDVIEEIIRTMRLGERTLRLDAIHGRSEAYIPATESDPPNVDFKKLAHEVVEEGLFQPLPRLSAEELKGPLMPQALVDLPYPNGPATIMVGGEVPVETMEAVRSGVARANRIVLKADVLGAYFNRRFDSDHPLLSPAITSKIGAFNAGYFFFKDPDAPPNDISFQTEGINRGTHNRKLYTSEEQLMAVQLAIKHPELVVAIGAYQGTIIDYLCELGVALANETHSGNLSLGQAELAMFGGYINEWRTNNFYHELLPSIAIFLHNARIREPRTHDDDLINSDLLRQAVDFVIRNGGLKKYMTVPAHVAANGEERTNKFACPAATIIREHLVDGRLLEQIYHYLRDQAIDGDSFTLAMLTEVKNNATREQPELYGHSSRERYPL